MRVTQILMTLTLVTAIPSCASNGDAELRRDTEEFSPGRDQRLTGKVIADFEPKIKKWHDLFFTGDRRDDQQLFKAIDAALQVEARNHFDVLSAALVNGALINRRRAAVAIGFTRERRSLSKLLAALDDPSSEVVAQALFGLFILDDPTTPPERFIGLAADTSRPLPVRNNALQVLRTSLRSKPTGPTRKSIVDLARVALTDETPSIRVHGAILLAIAEDGDSIDRLTALFADEKPKVVEAATKSVARIGDVDERYFGPAARALLQGSRDAESAHLRQFMLAELQKMAQVNFGRYEDWLQWASNLD